MDAQSAARFDGRRWAGPVGLLARVLAGRLSAGQLLQTKKPCCERTK